jgi:hypothetical protein
MQALERKVRQHVLLKQRDNLAGSLYVDKSCRNTNVKSRSDEL